MVYTGEPGWTWITPSSGWRSLFHLCRSGFFAAAAAAAQHGPDLYRRSAGAGQHAGNTAGNSLHPVSSRLRHLLDEGPKMVWEANADRLIRLWIVCFRGLFVAAGRAGVKRTESLWRSTRNLEFPVPAAEINADHQPGRHRVVLTDEQCPIPTAKRNAITWKSMINKTLFLALCLPRFCEFFLQKENQGHLLNPGGKTNALLLSRSARLLLVQASGASTASSFAWSKADFGFRAAYQHPTSFAEGWIPISPQRLLWKSASAAPHEPSPLRSLGSTVKMA